jgi:hypothetical protein
MNSDHDQQKEIHKEWGDLGGLCRAGGIAALLLIVYSLEMMVQMVVLGGQPASAAQAFDLLQHHRVLMMRKPGKRDPAAAQPGETPVRPLTAG